jgi:hypothetical protein
MLLLPKRQCKADTGSVLLLLLGLSTYAPSVAALGVVPRTPRSRRSRFPNWCRAVTVSPVAILRPFVNIATMLRLSYGSCGAGVTYCIIHCIHYILSLPSAVLLLARQLQYPIAGRLSRSRKLG